MRMRWWHCLRNFEEPLLLVSTFPDRPRPLWPERADGGWEMTSVTCCYWKTPPFSFSPAVLSHCLLSPPSSLPPWGENVLWVMWLWLWGSHSELLSNPVWFQEIEFGLITCNACTLPTVQQSLYFNVILYCWVFMPHLVVCRTHFCLYAKKGSPWGVWGLHGVMEMKPPWLSTGALACLPVAWREGEGSIRWGHILAHCSLGTGLEGAWSSHICWNHLEIHPMFFFIFIKMEQVLVVYSQKPSCPLVC